MNLTNDYSITLFNGFSDRHPTHFACESQSDLIESLKLIYETSGLIDPVHKASSLAISPAIYHTGFTRGLGGISHIAQWIGLDFDSGACLNDVITKLDQDGLGFFVHTTPSHSLKGDKFRVILFLDRIVSPDEYKDLWAGLALTYPDIDKACKDASRLYGAPINWAYADGSISIADGVIGKPVCVDSMIQMALDHEALNPKPYPLNQPVNPHPNAIRVRSYYDPTSLADLTSSPIVSQYAIENYRSCGDGTRHIGIYKFMCSCACRGVRLGIPVSAPDLVSLARQVERHNPRKSGWDKDLIKQANNALSHAQTNVQTKEYDPEIIKILK